MERTNTKKQKVCYTASSGGHLEELSNFRSLLSGDDFILTEKSTYNVIDWCSKIYFVNQINRREKLFIPKLLWLFVQSFIILLREKPSVIVSTGALATFPISFLGKLMGKRIVYIEIIALVYEGSVTGKLMYKFADLFIVQWEEMMKVFPKATYLGCLV
jgi:UDP-N-acetylglucosamine:LPS N-acetylglucosamine transferase